MWRAILLVILCTFTASLSEAAEDESILSKFSLPSGNSGHNLTVLESWENFEKSVKNAANSIIKMALPQIMESVTTMNLSQDCMRHNMHLINGLKNIKPWAVRCK